MKENRKQEGITLIEMIVAIAIMAIFLGVTGSLIAQSIGLYSKQSLTVSLEDQLRAVQDRITRDLRMSYTATTLTTATSSYLYFKPDNSTATATTDNYYEFARTEQRLYRKLKNGTRDPIADNINYASFRAYTVTPSTFQVDVELSASSKNVTKTTSFSVNLRNYGNGT
jgi:prepilin-type N-terminal cleavage/methylation domain-containing protein